VVEGVASRAGQEEGGARKFRGFGQEKLPHDAVVLRILGPLDADIGQQAPVVGDNGHAGPVDRGLRKFGQPQPGLVKLPLAGKQRVMSGPGTPGATEAIGFSGLGPDDFSLRAVAGRQKPGGGAGHPEGDGPGLQPLLPSSPKAKKGTSQEAAKIRLRGEQVFRSLLLSEGELDGSEGFSQPVNFPGGSVVGLASPVSF